MRLALEIKEAIEKSFNQNGDTVILFVGSEFSREDIDCAARSEWMKIADDHLMFGPQMDSEVTDVKPGHAILTISFWCESTPDCEVEASVEVCIDVPVKIAQFSSLENVRFESLFQ